MQWIRKQELSDIISNIYVLCAGAFVVPVWNIVEGNLEWWEVPYLTGRTLGLFLIFGAIAYALGRGRSPKTRAYLGQAAASCLLVVAAWVAAGRASENIEIRERSDFFIYLKGMQRSFVSIDARYKDLELGTLLSAANLTTPAGIENSRAKLLKVRGFVRERNEALGVHIQTTREKLAKLSHQTTRREMSLHIQEITEWMIFTSTSLSSIQLQAVDALDDVFDWAERNQDNIRDKQGRLTFATAELRREFDVLLNRVIKLARDEAEAVAKMRASTGSASSPSAMKRESSGRDPPASLAVAPARISAF